MNALAPTTGSRLLDLQGRRRLGTGRLVVGEHRQKGLPGAHLVAELLGHDSSDLSEVPEVMHYPG
jgi:hypothetical protein